jgi:gliding motility-associated lipoprotein GldB
MNDLFMKRVLMICLLPLLLYGCGSNNCEVQPDISGISVDVVIQRLDKELFSLKTPEEIQNFLVNHPGFADHFVFRGDYPHDSVLANQLFKMINDPYVDTLFKETLKVYDNSDFLQSEFELAFKHIKYYYPDFKPPIIQTAVTAFGNDLFVSDSLVIIGLDFFIGENAKYKPNTIPQYILKRYSKETIVPSAILLLSDNFNKTNHTDNSMLAEMIYYGKAYYFTKRMVPCLQDSVMIGYTSKEINGANSNSAAIWAHFIENELLYETNHFQKQKYLSERPKTLEIGNDCPGRIGTWVGYEVVKKFNKETKSSLQELMNEPNIQRILTQSKYKPKSS